MKVLLITLIHTNTKELQSSHIFTLHISTHQTRCTSSFITKLGQVTEKVILDTDYLQ